MRVLRCDGCGKVYRYESSDSWDLRLYGFVATNQWSEEEGCLETVMEKTSEKADLCNTCKEKLLYFILHDIAKYEHRFTAQGEEI